MSKYSIYYLSSYLWLQLGLLCVFCSTFGFAQLGSHEGAQEVKNGELKNSESKELPSPVEYSSIWLSWQRDPLTTMSISWLVPEKSKSATCPISYHKKEAADTGWVTAEGKVRPLPENVVNSIGTVELTGLSADTEYEFRIGNANEIWRFKTAPKNLDTPISFAVGGDTMHEVQLFRETCAMAASRAPLFVVFGGDLAYSFRDRYSKEDFGRWQDWFKTLFSTMRIDSNRLIPIQVTIGNHEVRGGFERTSKDAQLYYTLFNKPLEQGYDVIRFDEYLSLYLLDSEHTNSISGVQAEWLDLEMQQDSQMLNRMAVYHVPAYPSTRSYSNEYSSKIRKYWVPIFDKYRLHVAFENHDHTYKRTFPLRGGSIDPKGVVYIGDGAWGVEPRTPLKAEKTNYLAKSQSARQFCLVELSRKERQLSAIRFDGTVIDKVVEVVEDGARAKSNEGRV